MKKRVRGFVFVVGTAYPGGEHSYTVREAVDGGLERVLSPRLGSRGEAEAWRVENLEERC